MGVLLQIKKVNIYSKLEQSVFAVVSVLCFKTEFYGPDGARIRMQTFLTNVWQHLR